MTEAPERIHATKSHDGDTGSWNKVRINDRFGPVQIEYIRADVAQAMVAKAHGPNWEGFARDLMEHWPVRDVDGSELFDAALRNGLIQEIPGGYDPERHIDAEGICPEAGDPWYEYAFK